MLLAAYAAAGSQQVAIPQAPCAAAGSQQVAIPHEAPYAARGSLYAARLQPCSMLPMLQQAPNKWRYRTRLPMLLEAPTMLLATTMQHALVMLQPANRGDTALQSGSQRQCCCLASGSLYAARCCRL
jgi:hypothetical protein